MPKNIGKFFEDVLVLLKNNELSEIVSFCSFPLPVYIRGKIMLVSTPKNSRDAIATYRASLVKSGWNHSNLRVIAQSIIDENQISVWVESQHLDASETVVADSTTRYFCKLKGDKISKIEMIEYLDAPPTNLTEEWPEAFP